MAGAHARKRGRLVSGAVKASNRKDGKVKLGGDNVIEFQKLPEFQPITLKVLRWEERDKRLVIKEALMVA